MRALIRLLPGLAVLALAACATTSPTAMAPAPASSQDRPVTVADSAYIRAVEAQALRRGILVQWIHPPTKRLVATQD